MWTHVGIESGARASLSSSSFLFSSAIIVIGTVQAAAVDASRAADVSKQLSDVIALDARVYTTKLKYDRTQRVCRSDDTSRM